MREWIRVNTQVKDSERLFYFSLVKVLKINHIRNNHRNRWLTGLMHNAAQSWRQHVDDTNRNIWPDILIFHSMPLLSTCCPRSIKEQSLTSSQQMLKTWKVPRKPSKRAYCLPYPSVCQASRRWHVCSIHRRWHTHVERPPQLRMNKHRMNVKLFSLQMAWNDIKQIYWNFFFKKRACFIKISIVKCADLPHSLPRDKSLGGNVLSHLNVMLNLAIITAGGRYTHMYNAV